MYGRNTPFGFRWTDTTPRNCSIQSLNIMLLAGISCTGVTSGGGATTLNGQPLPMNYTFPFDVYNRNACSCAKPSLPPQVHHPCTQHLMFSLVERRISTRLTFPTTCATFAATFSRWHLHLKCVT